MQSTFIYIMNDLLKPYLFQSSPALNSFWLFICICMIKAIWFVFTGTVLTVSTEILVVQWYDTWKGDLGSIPSQDQYCLQ